jgi:circadian clock protein KaiB
VEDARPCNNRRHTNSGRLEEHSNDYVLRLYVAGKTVKAKIAFSNLKKVCEAQIRGHYSIEVVDLLESPARARIDQIFALPTVVRTFPNPSRRIIGDLSNAMKVLIGLDISQDNLN